MKRLLDGVVRLTGGLALVASVVFAANGASEGNEYRVIPARNVFNLHAQEPPPRTNEPPPPPSPNVKLTGITSMLGVKRAFFMVSPPAQPGKPPGTEQSFIIQEGQSQGGIDVLQVNEKAATVKIRNAGTETVLALNSSPVLPSGPAQAASGPGMAGASRARPPGGRPYGNFRRQSADATESASPLPVGEPSLASSPIPGAPSVAPATAAQQPPDVSLEEKAILTEIERQKTQSMVDQGLYPPIPDVMGLQSQQPATQGNDSATPSFPSFPTARK